MVYADNFDVVSSDVHAFCNQIWDVSNKLHAHGFVEKASSLLAMASRIARLQWGAHCDEASQPFELPEIYVGFGRNNAFKWVNEMEVLGVQVDIEGSPNTALNHRVSCASRHFYAHELRYKNKRIPLCRRLHHFSLSTVRFLFLGSGGWSIGVAQLHELVSLERSFLRQMCGVRWDKDNDNFGLFMSRAKRVAETWFANVGIRCVAEQLAIFMFRRVGHAAIFQPSPVGKNCGTVMVLGGELFQFRCSLWTPTTTLVGSIHEKVCQPDGNLFIECFGAQWERLIATRASWNSLEKDFVRWYLEKKFVFSLADFSKEEMAENKIEQITIVSKMDKAQHLAL